MKSRKGVTLIELMVVVLIVAVLAAVLVPLLTARLESARWSEGKAGVGTIATAIRAMYSEEGENFAPTAVIADYVNATDMYGKYFQIGDYSFQSGPTVATYAPGVTGYPVTFTIRVSRPAGASPDGNTYSWDVAYWEMDESGEWTKG
jgi:prepilin-type N-terminal cleavage/methylation domain-containing protein